MSLQAVCFNYCKKFNFEFLLYQFIILHNIVESMNNASKIKCWIYNSHTNSNI